MNLEDNIFRSYKLNKQINQDPHTNEFKKHKRHYFIFTKYGKPVFTRYGDEINCSGLMASLSTILEKYNQMYQHKQMMIEKEDPEQGNNKETIEGIRKIVKKNQTIIILQRSQLIYVCVSQENEESEFLIENSLDMLHILVISLVTKQVCLILERNPNFDPRNILNGTSSQILMNIKNSLNSIVHITRNIMCLPLCHSVRQQINEILKNNRDQDVVFSCLMTISSVIGIYKSNSIGTMQSMDLILLQNLLQANISLKQSQNWTPVCLPGVYDSGFLQAFIYFFPPHKNIALIIITNKTNNEVFHSFQQIANNIETALQQLSILDQIYLSIQKMPYSIPSNFQLSSLKNIIFIYKDMFSLPNYLPYGQQTKSFKILIKSFANIYQQYLQSSRNKSYSHHTKTNQNFISLVQQNDFLVYYETSPFINIQEIQALEKSIFKYLKIESINLFL